MGVKQERFGGDDDVRPKFPDSPAELSTLGEPTYRLHQALIALRRRNPWLLDARTETVKLENKHFVYRSTSADAQHSLTVDLNIEQSPTFTIRNADGSTAYQWLAPSSEGANSFTSECLGSAGRAGNRTTGRPARGRVCGVVRNAVRIG